VLNVILCISQRISTCYVYCGELWETTIIDLTVDRQYLLHIRELSY
jgi:hypothetical protein